MKDLLATEGDQLSPEDMTLMRIGEIISLLFQFSSSHNFIETESLFKKVLTSFVTVTLITIKNIKSIK